jgi:hypothetical protein
MAQYGGLGQPSSPTGVEEHRRIFDVDRGHHRLGSAVPRELLERDDLGRASRSRSHALASSADPGADSQRQRQIVGDIGDDELPHSRRNVQLLEPEPQAIEDDRR